MYTISKMLTMGVMKERQANFLTYDLHRASQNFFHIHTVNYTTKSFCRGCFFSVFSIR